MIHKSCLYEIKKITTKSYLYRKMRLLMSNVVKRLKFEGQIKFEGRIF